MTTELESYLEKTARHAVDPRPFHLFVHWDSDEDPFNPGQPVGWVINRYDGPERGYTGGAGASEPESGVVAPWSAAIDHALAWADNVVRGLRRDAAVRELRATWNEEDRARMARWAAEDNRNGAVGRS